MAKIVGIEVPIRVLEDQGTDWQESFVLEANRQRVKNPEQLAREYIELKRLELLNKSGKGTASERAAERVGMREDHARKMEVIIEAAEKGNPIAAEGLKKIVSRERSVVSVFNAVSQGSEPESTDYYREVAEALEEASNDFFSVSHSSNGTSKHGYVFKRRFANRAEAEGFVKLMQSIPASEQEAFAQLLAKNNPVSD